MHELHLHPAKFRTKMCRDRSACTRQICFFAHDESQLRSPTPEELEPYTPKRLQQPDKPISAEQQQQQQHKGGASAAKATAASRAGLPSVDKYADARERVWEHLVSLQAQQERADIWRAVQEAAAETGFMLAPSVAAAAVAAASASPIASMGPSPLGASPLGASPLGASPPGNAAMLSLLSRQAALAGLAQQPAAACGFGAGGLSMHDALGLCGSPTALQQLLTAPAPAPLGPLAAAQVSPLVAAMAAAQRAESLAPVLAAAAAAAPSPAATAVAAGLLPDSDLAALLAACPPVAGPPPAVPATAAQLRPHLDDWPLTTGGCGTLGGLPQGGLAPGAFSW